MGIIIALLIISILNAGNCVIFNKRYEQVAPFSILLIIIILYVFYIFDLLKWGFWGIIILTFMSGFYVLFKYIKNLNYRKKYFDNFFTPGFLIFILCSIVFYFITKNNYVMYFDELRLWAAYPKALFSFEKLVISTNEIFTTTYYPGMPLFQYFVAKCGNHFIESELYFSYAVVGLSFLIPFTKNINWKSYYLIIPCFLLLFIFPLIFANNGYDMLYYYRTLFIDPMIGLSFGYSLYLSTKKLIDSKFDYMLFCLSLSSVILFKVVGIVLATIVVGSFMFNQLFVHKTIKIKLIRKNYKNWLLFIIPLIVIFLAFFSWQFCSKINSINLDPSSNTYGLSIKDAVKIFIKPTNDNKIFLASYFDTIKNTTMIVSESGFSKYATIPYLIGYIILLWLLLFFAIKKDTKKIVASSLLFIISSIILWLAFYYVVYTLQFNRTVLCFGRYISPVFSGISVFTLMFITDIKNNIKHKELYFFILGLLIYPAIIPNFNINKYNYAPEVQEETNNYGKYLMEKTDTSEGLKKVLTLYDTCDVQQYLCVLKQHHLWLDVIDNNIIISSSLFMANKYTDIFVTDPENYKLTDFLKNNDYLLIMEDIKEINLDNKKYFGTDMTKGNLYEIIKNNTNDYELKKIN